MLDGLSSKKVKANLEPSLLNAMPTPLQAMEIPFLSLGAKMRTTIN